jgi:hypothetical protein
VGKYDGKKDIIYPTVYAYNSFDRAFKYSLDFGIMRIICTNGMMVGERFARFVMRHTTGLDVEKSIKILAQGFDIYEQQLGVWKQWQKVIMNFKDFENIVTALKFSNKALEELKELKEAGTGVNYAEIQKNKVSKWLAYCLLTQFVTHNIKSQMQRISYDQQVRRQFN